MRIHPAPGLTNATFKKLCVDKENTVRRRDVTLGALQKGLRVIESGIGPDDLVIVNGLQRARPGAKVAPHFPDETPEGTAPATTATPDKTASADARQEAAR